MSGPGRPTKTEVDRRRGELIRLMARRDLESGEAVKQLAKLSGVGAAAVRADLRAIAEAPSSGVPRLPIGLAEAFLAATTTEALFSFERRLVFEFAAGRVQSSDFDRLVRACHQIRMTVLGCEKEVPFDTSYVEGMDRTPM